LTREAGRGGFTVQIDEKKAGPSRSPDSRSTGSRSLQAPFRWLRAAGTIDPAIATRDTGIAMGKLSG
jgi:hypothetical protein